jgi:hypothetical protein
LDGNSFGRSQLDGTGLGVNPMATVGISGVYTPGYDATVFIQ